MSARKSMAHLFVDGAKGDSLCGAHDGKMALSINYVTCKDCQRIHEKRRLQQAELAPVKGEP